LDSVERKKTMRLSGDVRGHLSIPYLTSPFLLYPSISPIHMYIPHTSVPSPGTTPKANNLPDINSPKSLTFCSFLCSYLSSILDKHQTHWDRPMWHYGTLCCHVDAYLWEAWY
jgi:hypothetical protein